MLQSDHEPDTIHAHDGAPRRNPSRRPGPQALRSRKPRPQPLRQHRHPRLRPRGRIRGLPHALRRAAGVPLYALGLGRLAERGDLEAVAVLSDLISASAQAQAEGRPEDAEALWESSSDALVGLSPPGPPR